MTKNKESGIYRIIDFKGREYIGSSVDLQKRKYDHFWMLENNRHSNIKLQAFFNKYRNVTESPLRFEIIEICEKVALLSKEQEYLNSVPYYNISTDAKAPMNGRKHSAGTKKRMSESKKGMFCGEKNPMFGKTFSEEHREKISQKAMGDKNPFYGKKHSKETVQKMSKRIKQIDPHSKEVIGIFNSINDAARNGFNRTCISAVLNGRQKTHAECFWEVF